jgi:hypothetical protein
MNELDWAEPFLRYLQSLRQSRKSLPLMQTSGSQEPPTGSYPEPEDFSPHSPQTVTLKPLRTMLMAVKIVPVLN